MQENLNNFYQNFYCVSLEDFLSKTNTVHASLHTKNDRATRKASLTNSNKQEERLWRITILQAMKPEVIDYPKVLLMQKRKHFFREVKIVVKLKQYEKLGENYKKDENVVNSMGKIFPIELRSTGKIFPIELTKGMDFGKPWWQAKFSLFLREWSFKMFSLF